MEDYNTLLNRFDAVLIENEALKEEIKELKEDKKELKKDVEFYRSKIKVLLDDMLQFGRQAYVKSIDNDIKKVDINNMVTDIMRATLSYEQEINMNDKDKKELTTSLKCIINNNINLGDKGGK